MRDIEQIKERLEYLRKQKRECLTLEGEKACIERINELEWILDIDGLGEMEI